MSLTSDPKLIWATRHPEFFPINTNTAPKWKLLRVPGLGHITVNRILKRRKIAKLKNIEDLGKAGVRLAKAKKYLIF